MKLIKLCLICCLILVGCTKSEVDSDRYGNSMHELIENEIDKNTVELYQVLANKEYNSVTYDYYINDTITKIDEDHGEKLYRLFEIIDDSVFGLNLFQPGLTLDELEKLDRKVLITAIDVDGNESEFNIYLSDHSVIGIRENDNDYLIDFKGKDGLEELFDFPDVSIEAEESTGERAWANENTTNLFDMKQAFILTDWEGIYYRRYQSQNALDKALMAVFTLGSIEMPPRASMELFAYIMNEYPIMREINPSLATMTKEFHTLDGNEERIFYLPEEIPSTSSLMTGDQFRAVYRELFDAPSAFDESTSWNYSPQWFVRSSYFKDEDIYIHYQYPGGPISDDYSGWIMGIQNVSETEDTLMIHALAAYTEVLSQDNEKRCLLYDQEYAVIDAAHSLVETWQINDLLNTYQEKLLQLEIQLKKREDNTYAVLSVQYLNQKDQMNIANNALPIINTYKISDKDWTPIPQFNLSGSLAREVNLQLYYLKDKGVFNIYEDETEATVTLVEVEANKEEIIKGFRYDKGNNILSYLDGESIPYIYLNYFGSDFIYY